MNPAATTIDAVTLQDVDIPLKEPFGIATGAQVQAELVLVAMTLRDGTVGYGEAAPFPAVNGETRPAARMALASVAEDLVGTDAARWRPLSARIGERIPHAASAVCALETALLDAWTRHAGLSLLDWFGGCEHHLETDVTITTGGIEEAVAAARRLVAMGIRVLKVKVGGLAFDDEVARLEAIAQAAPGIRLLLDANGAMPDARTAAALVQAVERSAPVVLFEQPLPKDDLEGSAELVRMGVCRVAVDESIRTPADVVEVARRRAAHVVNLKLMKSGLVGAWEMAIVARAHGLETMVGAMVESPLGLSTSGALAAGLGGFAHVDLDTHLWMTEVPFEGGFVQRGAVLDFGGIRAGHGVVPDRALRARLVNAKG